MSAPRTRRLTASDGRLRLLGQSFGASLANRLLELLTAPYGVPILERTVDESRRPPRDLGGEIERFLAEHPGASTDEIARQLVKRDQDVRDLLRADPRFQPAPKPPGPGSRANRWVLAKSAGEPVPSLGTTSPEGGSTR